MEMWTVYRDPSDFASGVYVARRWLIDGSPEPVATNDVRTAATLDALRDLLPLAGLVCFTRSENDDPVIVETWL